MPSHTFKGWEHIDGSKVSREEIELSFEQVMQKARLIEESHKASLAERRTIWIRRAIFTAAAIVLLVISPIAALHIIDRQTDAVMNGYTAQRGEIGEVILPDGSTVTLNSGSTLSYPEKFGRRRVVRLSGEAVFTVTASRRHIFTVETDGMDVTAHGTVFNVRNYPEETAASATLCSGVVKVRNSGGKGHTITLEPDQVLTLEKETGVMTVSGADASEMTSWKEGDLRIKSLPLEQVLKIVERKFDVNIHLATDKYDGAILTAKFINDEGLEELMDALCKLVPGMQYTIHEKDIHIR